MTLQLQQLGSDAPPANLPKAGMLVIGSSAERAGLVVDGQGVEDAHCAIGVLKGGGWAIKDLGSRYGTMVNGKKVQSARLSAGDTILLGSRRLQVVDPDAPAPAAAPEKAPPAAEAPPPEPKPATKPEPATNGAGAKRPERIGGFRVDKLLGRGGMGTVFLAEQESLHRPVALKVLSPRLAADTDFVRKFQTEARAAAALSHPNVTVVHDVGEAGGYHYLAMEYMEKGSLEDRLAKDGKLPWREVLDVLHDAAGGLMFAEERGIVHRDIKPANLMQNAAGTIKIADLGLATHVEADATESEGKKIFGTPHFISPEQARGEAVDNRSDLYSLGATAYRLLTGHTPFEGETTRDILRGHFTEEPQPLHDYVPEVPQGLESLIARLLAKEPESRPASAQFLLGEVDRLRLEADHGVGGPALAVQPKSRAGLLIGIAAAVIVLGGAGLFLSGALGGGDDEEDAGGDALAAGPFDSGDPGGPGELSDVDDASLFAPPEVEENDGAGEAVEADLEQQNLLAKIEYLELEQDDALTKADRIFKLEDLIARFPGTDTAGMAADDVERLRGELAAERETATRIGNLLVTAEKALRNLARLPLPEGEIPHPGDQLRQILAFAPAPELAEAPEFEDMRNRVSNEVVAAASEAFAGELARVAALAAEGRFAEIRPILEGLLPRFDLPEYEAGTEPAGFAELRLLGDRVRGRLERLDSEAVAWAEHLARSDREALSAGLPGGGGVEGALRMLDLSAAETRLTALRAAVGTDEARSLVDGLLEDVRGARAAIDVLIAEFNGGWRRQAVSDPRSQSAKSRDAVAIDASGITLDNRGARELVPWSLFAGETKLLHELFENRLKREYTGAERDSVRALLRLSAVLEAVELAAQKIAPSSTARFSDAEADAMGAAFAVVAQWSDGDDARLERDREASAILARALLDLEAGVWSASAAAMERLLAEFRDTLVVGLLSDGSDWREEPVADQGD